MATGTFVAGWRDGTHAYGAVRVTEGADEVEYVASTPLRDDQGNAKTTAVLKTELAADARLRRAARAAAPVAVAGITGTVAL